MHQHTHIDVDALNLPDLEALRQRVEISQARLCREAGLSTSTYQRWIKYLHALPGGKRPQKRTMDAVRAAMKKMLSERQCALAAAGVDRLAS